MTYRIQFNVNTNHDGASELNGKSGYLKRITRERIELQIPTKLPELWNPSDNSPNPQLIRINSALKSRWNVELDLLKSNSAQKEAPIFEIETYLRSVSSCVGWASESLIRLFGVRRVSGWLTLLEKISRDPALGRLTGGRNSVGIDSLHAFFFESTRSRNSRRRSNKEPVGNLAAILLHWRTPFPAVHHNLPRWYRSAISFSLTYPLLAPFRTNWRSHCRFLARFLCPVLSSRQLSVVHLSAATLLSRTDQALLWILKRPSYLSLLPAYSL